MRSIGIRGLRKDLRDNLDDLPFEITIRGEVVAVVNGVWGPQEREPIKAKKKKVLNKITYNGKKWKVPIKLCPHDAMPHLCKHRKCRE